MAPAIGADSQRLFQWCAAFAAMTALEIAEAPQSSPERVALWVALAEAES